MVLFFTKLNKCAERTKQIADCHVLSNFKILFENRFFDKNLGIAKKIYNFATQIRGVAQPGLEYASGGRVVASSNLVTPTEDKRLKIKIFQSLNFPKD